MSKMNFQEVKEFCDKSEYSGRKNRYKIMEEKFGVGAGTCEDIIKFDRHLRDVFPVDERGIELEKEWHCSPALKGEEQRLFKLSQIM